MRIGELSRRTGVAPRLLRYYEQQGLLSTDRAPNGYRIYAEDDVARVERIAGMVRSGVPTKLVRAILGLEGVRDAAAVASCSRDVAEQLAAELRDIEARIECLSQSRDTIRTFLSRTRHHHVLDRDAGLAHSTVAGVED